MLRGRDSERGALDRLLEAVRGGESRALVLRGEPGVGKTALLGHLHDRATTNCRVARVAGVQSEMELAFAGLHQLCAPLLDRLGRLPDPQRDALATAFGMRNGSAPDRFLIGLAALSLLSEAAEDRPLVCLVDDAQWLDRETAQTLAFVARRLDAESVALVFAVRGTRETHELAGPPELLLGGLSHTDARLLLGSVIQGPLDERVRDRIVAETRGNPLALLELPRGLTPDELAGGFGFPGEPELAGRVEESFLQRLELLPAETQQLLLVSAADPLGDPLLVWRAAERLGIEFEAAEPAGAAGLLEFGAHVRFRHPLVRSAVYGSATPEARRRVHAALAEATDPAVAPERRAWHRAQATGEPDEEVAAELERSAGRAQGRGGLAAAAAFLERAVELTSDPARRVQRALAAAQAKHEAGAPASAVRMLAVAEAGPLDELQRAQVELLRAQIAFAANRGSDAPPLLLAGARRLEPLNAAAARETYLYAMFAALFADRLASGGGVLEIAEAARAGPRPAPPPGVADLLLDGLAAVVAEGYAPAAPILKDALAAFHREPDPATEGRWVQIAGHVALVLWDFQDWEALCARQIQLARDAGALVVLPVVLSSRTVVHLFAGELDRAAALVEEVATFSEATGTPPPPYGEITLAAWQGREEDTTALIATHMKALGERGEGLGVTVTQWANAVLFNGLGRFEDALAAAEEAGEGPQQRQRAALGLSTWALVELVEAAARSGQPERGAGAHRLLAERTQAAGTEWALGTEARSRALLSDGAAAEDGYREALERLGRSGAAAMLARTHLVYGEWLRSVRRRADAREQLRIARERCAAMGLAAFAERAARELRIAGESTRERAVEIRGHLTTQEAQIARLARDGLSNPEIGARLFLSRRTVEYHLHKVFAKLGISSRGELAGALPGEPAAVGAG